ncbi:hypothetical protein Tco_1294402 [Tanacetum coccineum]
MENVFYISNCSIENQVKFATYTLLGGALTWWNSHLNTVVHDTAYAMPWKIVRDIMTTKYYPRSEIKKLEIEQHLSDEVEKYVGGLPDLIHGNVMSYRLKTMQEAIEFINEQMDQKLRTIAERQAENKRKFDDNSRNNQNQQQQPFKRHNVVRAYTAGPGEKKEYEGSLPKCTKCNYHHNGPCAPKCNNGKKVGHLARDCRSPAANANNQRAPRQFKGLSLVLNVDFKGITRKIAQRINPNSNVITGTFLLNNRYASILFDTGVDRSFVSTAFSSLIDIDPTTLDYSYDVELADEKIIELAKYHAVIVCDEKIIRVPFGDEILIFHSEGSNHGHKTRLNIISCTKTQKYLLKGCPVFLAHITAKKAEDKSEEKQFEDIPIVQDFPEKEELYAKFSKCEFWIPKVQFLSHVIDSKGFHVDLAKIESVKDWASPKTPMDIRQFLGLVGHYRRFIEGFSKIAKPMTKLTQKKIKMVVKEIISRFLEEEEKLEWWFEQDIDKEEVRFEGDEV